MEEWKEYKLSEIGTVVGGATPSTKNPFFYDGEIPWITPKDLTDWNEVYISRGERSITKEGYNSSSCKLVPKGTVLFTSRAPIGYIAIAANELCTNQGFKSIVPNNELVDSEFLFYSLLYNKNKIKALGSGTTFAEISGKVMASVVISIPELTTQRIIASQLSEIDDKISVNRRICENLETQAQALFKHWFIDFAPFKNGKFVESELGMIPEGWRVGRLGEICTTNKRTLSSKNTPNVIEYLDTGNITANKIDNIQILYNGQDKIPSRAKRLVSEGDIIFSSVRPNQRHYGLLMNPSPSLVVSTGFVVITAIWSGFRYFIYHFLIQNSIIETLQAIGEQSVSTYPSINSNDIESLKVIIPRMEDVMDFADICCNFYCKMERIEQESTRLSTLRDALLPKLMSGQIKVNEIEI